MKILEGDCLSVMPTLDADSIDAVICDPPYGLKFMGKEWDHGVPGVPFWEAANRVAKPGAYLLAFGGTRTHHRLTCAIEDAGWELRDCLMWLYGSGFPKSHDISKAIDRAAGATREVLGQGVHGKGSYSQKMSKQSGFRPYHAGLPSENNGGTHEITAPNTDAARQWEGWGTALKPAWEPVILARKPIIGTVAANVQEHGTGALNIDGCRIDGKLEGDPNRFQRTDGGWKSQPYGNQVVRAEGRWPANVVLDEEAAAMLDEQTGAITSVTGSRARVLSDGQGSGEFLGAVLRGREYPNDTGGASRFFYTAKASRSEREAGLESHPLRAKGENLGQLGGLTGSGNPRNYEARNNHPTVKPLDLMQWLCRLVTPPGGLVLDPFCGSGTTGRAAVAEGFSFIGIEKDPEYAAIARARIAEYAPLFGDVA